jgi:hypothetical protein
MNNMKIIGKDFTDFGSWKDKQTGKEFHMVHAFPESRYAAILRSLKYREIPCSNGQSIFYKKINQN